MKLSLSCCGAGNAVFRETLDARVSQEEIGTVYDKLAGLYDVWGVLTESRARKRALELAQIQDGQNILEVAVGTGLAFYEIVKRNPRGNNVGIDISPGMLAKAKKRLSRLSGANYELLNGTAFVLPVKSGSLDVLMNNYLFDLLAYEDMDKVLDEFHRALKSGGRMVLANMTHGESVFSRFYDVISRLYPKAMGGCRGVKLAERLTKHGFRVEMREYHQQLLFPSEVLLAHKK